MSPALELSGETLGAARALLGATRVEAPLCRGSPPPRRGDTWVAPRAVCEVAYLERGAAGLLRHASFVRFRPDKAVTDCNPEP
jgi:ATP-dependent DNA ligase